MAGRDFFFRHFWSTTGLGNFDCLLLITSSSNTMNPSIIPTKTIWRSSSPDGFAEEAPRTTTRQEMLSFRQGYPKGYVETNAFPKQCHVKEDGHRDYCSDRKGKETRSPL
ncbi:hypothetical protein OUZ56_028120 [Daphnia magna]|uniref:Uncharacterized protein n=1 Tax=Daphnia magna TaxID=35525 RepID=A0ABR0B2X0_9CRUS|nr:hypothetical protein OUZ56_028120 [Daphnia magna]